MLVFTHQKLKELEHEYVRDGFPSVICFNGLIIVLQYLTYTAGKDTGNIYMYSMY